MKRRGDKGRDDMNQESRSLQDLARYAGKGGPRRGVRRRQADAPATAPTPGPAARPPSARPEPDTADTSRLAETADTVPPAAPAVQRARKPSPADIAPPTPQAPQPPKTAPRSETATARPEPCKAQPAARPRRIAIPAPVQPDMRAERHRGGPERAEAPRQATDSPEAGPEGPCRNAATPEPATPRAAEPPRPTEPPRPAEPAQPPAPSVLAEPVTADPWSLLREVPLDETWLARNRLISAARNDPAHAAFEVLRTRLIQALAEHGWTRVAITSPTKDCGKSFVAANLALSLSRHETARTVLMDMDLRNPSLAKLFGISAPGTMGDFLSGRSSTAQHFLRFAANRLKIGGNLAMGLNEGVESFASEMLQLPTTAAALARMRDQMAPDIVLFDLPPALYHDDVLAFRPEYDGVLLVVGGGITRADEIREVSRRLSDHTPLLGVVLNRAEGPTITNYSY